MTLGGAGVVVLHHHTPATVLLALLAVAFCIKICLTVSGRSLKPRGGKTNLKLFHTQLISR